MREYPSRFEHFYAQRSAPTSTGERTVTYTGGVFLWGSILEESASEQTEMGSTRARVDGVVRLRNKITVSVADRLHNQGDIWLVDGVRYATNQTILDVHCLRETIL